MNIYDEAFNDLLKYFHENKPLENIDDTLVKIEHGLDRAKKVEELLGQYQVLVHDLERDLGFVIAVSPEERKEKSQLRFIISQDREIIQHLEKELEEME